MSVELKLFGNGDLRLVPQCQMGELGADEARVRITHLALNHLDLYAFRGMVFAKRQLPMVVGVEAVGVVEAVGAACERISVGQRVVVFPGIVCGECAACVEGRENSCLEPGGIRGFRADGLARSVAVLPERDLIEVPDNVDDQSAVCAPVAFGTAEHMLVDKAALREGETILVHAAGSGVGSAAIQIARDIGATVYATVGSDEKIAPAHALGAAEVINYSEGRFDRQIRKITKKRGVDVVFEHVGPTTWQGSLMSLARGGRLVTCGSTSGTESTINIFHLFNMQISILASFGCTRKNVRDVLQKMATGKIRATIDSEYAIDDFELALDRIRSRKIFGKVIILVN